MAGISTLTYILKDEFAGLPEKELVKIIVEAPDDTEISDSPLAKQIIYAQKNFVLWASVCRAAREDPRTSQDRKTILAIEEINALRRTINRTATAEESKRIIEIIYHLLAYVNTRVILLPTNDRERRIASLYFYNAGQINELTGRYNEAIFIHRAEAKMAATRIDKLRSSYLAALCALNKSLIDNKGIRRAYGNFRTRCYHLNKVLNKEVETEARWIGNVECNLKRATFLVATAMKIQRRKFIIPLIFSTLPDKVQRIFSDYTDIIDAWERLTLPSIDSEGLEYAEDLASQIAMKPDIPVDWRCDALFVTALTQLRQKRTKSAITTLTTLINITGYGGYAPKAVAERLLKTLKK